MFVAIDATRRWMSLRTLFVERANGAFELDLFRNDVGAIAAGKAADRHNRRRLGDVHLTADDRLQAHHDLRSDDDRIDAAPGHGAVRLSALAL